MTKIKIITVIIAFCAGIFAQNYKISQEVCSLAIKVNDLLVNCEFDKAYKITDKLLKENPDEPLFYYLSLASIGLKSLDFDEILDKEKFNKIYQKGMTRVNKMIEDEPQNCDLLMIRGFLMSSSAAYMLLDGKYSSGVSLGTRSLDILKKAHECDTTNYDTEYYLGFYNYAQAELRRRLGVLFWLPRNANDGIAALERCIEKARFMNRAAEMVLVDVYVREGKPEKSKVLLPKLLEKYPESRFLLWTKMRYEIATGNESAAMNTALAAAHLYFRDGAQHNGIMILREVRKMAGTKKFSKEMIDEITKFADVLDRKNLSNSDIRTFNSLLKE